MELQSNKAFAFAKLVGGNNIIVAFSSYAWRDYVGGRKFFLVKHCQNGQAMGAQKCLALKLTKARRFVFRQLLHRDLLVAGSHPRSQARGVTANFVFVEIQSDFTISGLGTIGSVNQVHLTTAAKAVSYTHLTLPTIYSV